MGAKHRDALGGEVFGVHRFDRDCCYHPLR